MQVCCRLQDGKFASARGMFPPIVTSSWLAVCGASSHHLNLKREQVSGESSAIQPRLRPSRWTNFLPTIYICAKKGVRPLVV
jgi:hypothetical protein